ncbi:MAG: tetratricopeptide repeat protein [Gemmatimonadetes bacterium]|nr:tetratricopeptide repeat protein [Gemmatimonadota bacterium]MYG85468.1 tetratricopeptide repeat protein [Gemmatimonadota bacterium]MYJ88209.1 tetratricopeptide repeat protein [Gemmatimonadota bacterium]
MTTLLFVATAARFIPAAALILFIGAPCGQSLAQSGSSGSTPTGSPGTGPLETTPAGLSPLEEGRRLYGLGAYSDALSHLEQAVLDDEKAAPAHYWLGMALYALSRDEEALESFKTAVRRDKYWAPGHVGMGLVYARMPRRRLDARKALRKALRLDPGSAEYRYIMGLTFMDQGDKGWLIGSDPDGRDYFQRAVELDPTHPDAWFQLGRCYEELNLADRENLVRDRYNDYIQALNAYLKQYQVNPEHPEALRRFAGICHRFEYYERGAERLRQMAEEMEGIVPDVIRAMLTQFEALTMSNEQQYDLLQRSLETYIKTLDPPEQEVYADLVHVAPPDVLEAWRSSEGADREKVWRDFWNARDSNPATVENERLVEHYKRVMYSRLLYSSGQHPYDRRGEVYVRYGAPDDRRRFVFSPYQDPDINHQLTGNPAVDAIRERNLLAGYQLRLQGGPGQGFLFGGYGTAPPPAVDLIAMRAKRELNYGYTVESWVYVKHDMELFFVDLLSNGNFDYPLWTADANRGTMVRQHRYHPTRVAEELIEKTPEDYAHDFGGESLDYAFDVTTFRGAGDWTVMELAYSIPVWQFGDVTDGRGAESFLSNQAALRDSVFSPVFNQRFRFGPIERPKRKISSDQARVSAYALAVDVQVPPGQFTAAVEMRDEASRRIGIYKKPVTVPDYGGRHLMISDLKLSTGITPADQPGPFVRQGLNILPHPLRAYGRGQLVYVYYEVYNLGQDEAGSTSYATHFEINPEGMPDSRGRFGGQPGRPGQPGRRDGPGDQQTVVLTYEGEGDASEEAEYTAIDTADLTPGVYVLNVTVEDRQTGERVTRSTSFILLEQ